jgi:hypothetical protein
MNKASSLEIKQLLENDIDAVLHSADAIELELHKRDPSNPILHRDGATYSPSTVSPRWSKPPSASPFKTSRSCEILPTTAALAPNTMPGSPRYIIFTKVQLEMEIAEM